MQNADPMDKEMLFLQFYLASQIYALITTLTELPIWDGPVSLRVIVSKSTDFPPGDKVSILSLLELYEINSVALSTHSRAQNKRMSGAFLNLNVLL